MRTRTLLVVEDDPSIRQLLSDALEQEGHRVIATGDGEEAIGLAEREHPDGIVLDLGLPLLDGEVVADRIRGSCGAAMPLIVVTASDRAREAMGRLRAAACLIKPFEIADFVRAVDAATQPPPAAALGEDPVTSPAT